MKLRSCLTAIVSLTAVSFIPAALAGDACLLGGFRDYHQGKPLAGLIETRQAVFQGTADDEVRAARERELLAFIASEADVEAKAIAIEWLGCLGGAASITGLVAARETPELAAAVDAALARIPGAEAEEARGPGTAGSASIAPSAAAVATLRGSLGKRHEDESITASLKSPDDFLAVAAMRFIRDGAGSARLMKQLASSLDQMPASRQGPLGEALATRREAVDALHPVLVGLCRAGTPEQQAAACVTLGRILRPDDLPMVLERAAGSGVLAEAAKQALSRATEPGIDAALIRVANAGEAGSGPAIEALAKRHVVDAVDPLWNLTTSGDAAISAAAYKALGVLVPPAQLPALLDRLAASRGKPTAANMETLAWNVIRRHPDPAAAADLLDKRAAAATGDLKPLLTRYATRIRPKQKANATPELKLPEQDDRTSLMPDGYQEVAYHDCGSLGETSAGRIGIRRTSGQAFRFGEISHALATVDFGSEVRYEITGLDPDGDYVLGLSAWDVDQKGRRQSLAVNGSELLTDFAPIAYHANEPTFTRIHLPLRRELSSGGAATLVLRAAAGPNAVVSELWLLRRDAAAPATRRVVIVSGDDFPAHQWRVTGPEFAAILRADPRLEVTITESPSLLASPAISSYDAVFLHFKNYKQRLPTSEALWKNLESYIHGGGGMVIAHFGCGAMEEWDGFVKLAGRVWDPELPGHDPYGEFLVRILQSDHPATAGIGDFTTTDELYTCLAGDTEIRILAEATSKRDQNDHPMALVVAPGNGRVFHCSLGHDHRSLQSPGTRKLYLQGTLWAAGAHR